MSLEQFVKNAKAQILDEYIQYHNIVLKKNLDESPKVTVSRVDKILELFKGKSVAPQNEADVKIKDYKLVIDKVFSNDKISSEIKRLYEKKEIIYQKIAKKFNLDGEKISSEIITERQEPENILAWLKDSNVMLAPPYPLITNLSIALYLFGDQPEDINEIFPNIKQVIEAWSEFRKNPSNDVSEIQKNLIEVKKEYLKFSNLVLKSEIIEIMDIETSLTHSEQQKFINSFLKITELFAGNWSNLKTFELFKFFLKNENHKVIGNILFKCTENLWETLNKQDYLGYKDKEAVVDLKLLVGACFEKLGVENTKEILLKLKEQDQEKAIFLLSLGTSVLSRFPKENKSEERKVLLNGLFENNQSEVYKKLKSLKNKVMKLIALDKDEDDEIHYVPLSVSDSTKLLMINEIVECEKEIEKTVLVEQRKIFEEKPSASFVQCEEVSIRKLSFDALDLEKILLLKDFDEDIIEQYGSWVWVTEERFKITVNKKNSKINLVLEGEEEEINRFSKDTLGKMVFEVMKCIYDVEPRSEQDILSFLRTEALKQEMQPKEKKKLFKP